MGIKETYVLLIDNEPEFADALRDVFEPRGITIVNTSDTEYAIEAANRDNPTIIILNADIPKGFSVCRKIKKNQRLKDIPLVLTTEKASDEIIEKHKTLNARADYYFRRPFDANKLLELLPAEAPVEVPAEQSEQPENSHKQLVIDDLTSEITMLNLERETLQNQLSNMDSLEKQIQTYQGTVMALESSTKALQQRISQLEAELERKKSIEANHLKQIEELKRNEGLADSLNQQIESTTNIFEKLEQGYKQQISALNSDNEHLSEKNLDMQREIASLRENLAESESKTKGYKALKTKAMQAEQLKEDLNKIETELQGLREYKERMEPLEKDIEDIQAVQAKFAVVEKERDELLAAIGEMEIQTKKASQELRHTMEQYKKAKQNIADIRSIICTEE